MMNLNVVEKKWLSRIAITIGILLIIALSWKGIDKLIKNSQDKKIKALTEQNLVNQAKADSLLIVNIQKDLQIKESEKQVEYWQQVKSTIKWRTDEKIIIIYSGSPIDNARRMDTILNTLDYNLGQFK